PADIQFLKLLKKKRINGILQRFRQLVAAGAKISSGRMLQVFQLLTGESITEIQDAVFQKTLDPIYHTVNFADFIRMSQPLGNNSVKAAVDHCSRTAGLADDKILLCHRCTSVWDDYQFYCIMDSINMTNNYWYFLVELNQIV